MRQVTLMKKLLFFDIDGTLVDFGNSTMSPSTADALINAKQNGHMIFLCTGRSYNQIYPSLKAFDFDGVVAAAGGYVTVGDKVIAHHVYGQNLLQKVLDTVGDNDTGLIFQTRIKASPTTSGPTNSYQHSQSSLTCMLYRTTRHLRIS